MSIFGRIGSGLGHAVGGLAGGAGGIPGAVAGGIHHGVGGALAGAIGGLPGAVAGGIPWGHNVNPMPPTLGGAIGGMTGSMFHPFGPKPVGAPGLGTVGAGGTVGRGGIAELLAGMAGKGPPAVAPQGGGIHGQMAGMLQGQNAPSGPMEPSPMSPVQNPTLAALLAQLQGARR